MKNQFVFALTLKTRGSTCAMIMTELTRFDAKDYTRAFVPTQRKVTQ